MNVDFITINNFYDDADHIRKFALGLDFNRSGNYPGRRTVPYLDESVKAAISKLLHPHAGSVVDWGDQNNFNSGSFQVCMENDVTWVHADVEFSWSGVCYLQKNPPKNTGTGFYKHKQTQQRYYAGNFHDGHASDDWELVDNVENQYNRLVLFRSFLFHKAQGYFGNTLETGRLFQTFFFRTEH